MNIQTSVSIEFSLQWRSDHADHVDRYFMPRDNLEGKTIPAKLQSVLNQLAPGESCQLVFDRGELITGHDPNAIIRFERRLFQTRHGSIKLDPRVGRFYPQGFAYRGLDCDKANYRPFRLISIENNAMLADTNHPLANYPLTLKASCHEQHREINQAATRPNSLIQLMCDNGPGMQAPHCQCDNDFYNSYPFKRHDEQHDAVFYRRTRMVHHLDKSARQQVRNIYARTLKPGMTILDLMSSWESHIPESITDCRVTGIGMNEEELLANPQLNQHLVQDLNAQVHLPFADNSFDAIINTVSIEYLLQPLEVMREVARVTRPGGLVVTTFSNRWFPGREITAWSEMHPFERLGLVLDYYRNTGRFINCHSETVRGLPRPKDDPHYRKTHYSDPIYAVWGSVSK